MCRHVVWIVNIQNCSRIVMVMIMMELFERLTDLILHSDEHLSEDHYNIWRSPQSIQLTVRNESTTV